MRLTAPGGISITECAMTARVGDGTSHADTPTFTQTWDIVAKPHHN